MTQLYNTTEFEVDAHLEDLLYIYTTRKNDKGRFIFVNG